MIASPAARAGIPLLLLVALALAAAGCGPAERAGTDEGVLRSDSAGVEIVTSLRPVWIESEGWRVGDTPSLELGARPPALVIFDAAGVPSTVPLRPPSNGRFTPMAVDGCADGAILGRMSGVVVRVDVATALIDTIHRYPGVRVHDGLIFLSRRARRS